MAFTVRQRVLALLLALIGGAAWWQYSVRAPEALPARTRERLPDYTVEHFNATEMDLTGRPARRLTAEMMRHYPDDDSAELDLPVLILHRPDGRPWDIRSETGWVSGDGELVLLHGQVRADREGGGEGGGEARPIHLKTSELLVRPRQEYAETAMPVDVASGEDWLRSTGMQVWFAETALRARFLGRARGRFAVQ
jgi:lipopolysaccharide export system protein LptC